MGSKSADLEIKTRCPFGAAPSRKGISVITATMLDRTGRPSLNGNDKRKLMSIVKKISGYFYGGMTPFEPQLTGVMIQFIDKIAGSNPAVATNYDSLRESFL